MEDGNLLLVVLPELGRQLFFFEKLGLQLLATLNGGCEEFLHLGLHGYEVIDLSSHGLYHGRESLGFGLGSSRLFSFGRCELPPPPLLLSL